jgi:hypothetical protein
LGRGHKKGKQYEEDIQINRFGAVCVIIAYAANERIGSIIIERCL